MEDNDVTFTFQLGLIRDSVTMKLSCFTLKTLKEAACNFVNVKVSNTYLFLLSCAV